MTDPTPGRGRPPVPDLDTRTWHELVEDTKERIGQSAPRWTDRGPSDLGVTLVELFAWLVEGLTFKLNQVPEKNYLAFLNLLGITRTPATPARVVLRFTPAPGAGAVQVEAGTRAATRQTESEAPVVFETDTDLVLSSTPLTATLVVEDLGGTPRAAALGGSITLTPGSTTQLCLGFDEAPAQPFDLHVELDGPLPGGAQPRVTWVYSVTGKPPGQWPVADVVDRTGGLRRSAAARLDAPGEWAKQAPKSWNAQSDDKQERVWIGARIGYEGAKPGEDTPPTLSLRIRLVGVNLVTATSALSTPSAPDAREVLGHSDGRPFQVFELRHRPVHETREPAASTTGVFVDGAKWARRDELPEGAGTVFRLDPVTGEVRFGNHDGVPQGDRRHGTIPPAGAVITASYRYVDTGLAANVAAGTVTTLYTPPRGVVAVTNPLAASGGADEEPIEQTKARAPELLRNRNRAVTVDDYEFLAREHTHQQVAITRCLRPRVHDSGANRGKPWTYGGLNRAPGTVNVIIVPRAGLAEPEPEPSIALVHDVRAELDARRDLVADLVVTGPRYLPILVDIEVVVFQQAIDERRIGSEEEAFDAIRKAVERFLHPVLGGPQGRGWEVGQSVFASDMYAAVRPPVEVGYITKLELGAAVPKYHQGGASTYKKAERPPPLNVELPTKPADFRPAVRLTEYELPCLGGYDVTAAKEG